MAILGYKPILEIPSRCLYLPENKLLTLEEVITEDFGKRSIQRLEGYGIQLEVPNNDDFVLKFYRGNPIKGNFDFGGGRRLTIGQTYEFPSGQMTSIDVHSSVSAPSLKIHQREKDVNFKLWMNLKLGDLRLEDQSMNFLEFDFYFLPKN